MIDIKKLLTNILVTLKDKQDTLVSGTNIKTINNTSLLGSGNISAPNTTYSFTRTKHSSSSRTQGSSSQDVHSFSITKPSGYNTAMGIVGIHFDGTGVGQLVPYSWYLSVDSNNNYTVNVGVRNNNSNSNITFAIDVWILWYKTN